MQAYSLFELNEFIRRILALNLPDEFWVRCEMAQVSHSRGHYYLELVEKEEQGEQIVAQSSAVIWAKDHKRLLRKTGTELNYVLQEGMEVQLLVKVDFHERYGLKLMVKDIDPTYTLGKLEMKRRETIRELKRLDLLEKNTQLPLPGVLQKIAVLTSERAAGYQDYLAQLKGNEYAYAFSNQLFESAVQGVNVESEMIQQLKKIERYKSEFDCVVIIRGGGARLDLAGFDNLELCKAIANCPLPVFTGIGHDIDETVADLVAHRALKTPTAVADFLIHRNLQFESEMIQLGILLNNQVTAILQAATLKLQKIQQAITFQSESSIFRQNQMLGYIEEELPKSVLHFLKSQSQNLDNLETLVQLLHPETALKRGFTITSKNGKSIHSQKSIKKGDELTTTFWNGIVKSKVEN